MNEKEVFNLDTKQIETLPQEESAKGETLPSLEKVQSPEMMEAEQIAREKLEKLMREDFKDFAVRFMNVGEYRKIIKGGGSSYRSRLKERQSDIYEGGCGEVYVPKLEE